MFQDFIFITQWWFYIFLIGLIFFPITTRFFSQFKDLGYPFSKVIAIAILTYIVFILGSLHLLVFNRMVLLLLLLIATTGLIFIYSKRKISIPSKNVLFLWVFEEILFFLSLWFWSYIKAFQPDIHGLEKFMDFGFMNSILRSTYFPPTDMWFTPLSINYYYFGHMASAFLIKLSAVPTFIAYNLLLSTIFAFTVTLAFSLVYTITFTVLKKTRTSMLTGLLAAIVTTLGGNLHTIYTLFNSYDGEHPVPLWKLGLNLEKFPNNYWYPNATRFIPFTIHEFPAYSFVVSDLHGHVLDIPFVFLTLALIYSLFLQKRISYITVSFISFLLAVMYMTNAWDGIIYFGLFSLAIALIKFSNLSFKKIKKQGKNPVKNVQRVFLSIRGKRIYFFETIKLISIALIGYIVFALPFNIHFKPFVSGIGFICAPSFLTKIGSIGPLLFEADHCQKSPLWQLFFLYGFFYIVVGIFIVYLMRQKGKLISPTLGYILLLILFSTILIITPEFIYAKDIYPAHYRANTMFKLGYQAFIMLSLCSTFIISYLLNKWKRYILLPIFFILLSLVLIYPYFAVNSYFDQLKHYRGLNGLSYIKTLYPDDYEAITWIQRNISGQPVILESQGDSYTDYGRISANTGLPTVLGWTVHEWLWRGEYSIPAGRLDDVRALYEDDATKTIGLIKKYNISYVYIGDLERTKYPNINEEKFKTLGELEFQKNNTKIIKLYR